MRNRTVWLALSALLFPLTARAHEHSAECFVGGSGESGSLLRGFHAWVDWHPKKTGQFSFLVDVSAHAGTHDGLAREEATLSIVGVRWSPKKKTVADGLRFVPSFHVLPFGIQHAKVGSNDGEWGKVIAGGTGLDVLIRRRPQDKLDVGIRGQVDVVRRYEKGTRTAKRASLGLIVRFRH